MILAGDIGGTKVNLGLFESSAQRVEWVTEESYPSQKHSRFEEIIQEFLTTAGPREITGAAFGVAGPVRKGRVHPTNLPWNLDAATLAKEFKIGAVSLLNDLEANAYGLAELSPEDFHVLNRGEPGATGNAAMIAAGTGLGEAGLYWDGQQHRPFACEGGHASFAPDTELDAILFDWLRERFGHVSWERVLSGPGLFNIYQFLRETNRGDEPAALAEALRKADPALVISQAATAGTSSRCVEAMDLFVEYYGAEAGNLALKVMSTGGVFIGGGIAPKILKQLETGNFLPAFFTIGRMKPLLEAMPVRVILNPKTALLGAAHYAAFGPQSISNLSEL
ncbi:MAG TPA: glucokinase [Verrucomicrobiae bacterium]|nr:glucokinase [Verrucomicrobiae bacterium]